MKDTSIKNLNNEILQQITDINRRTSAAISMAEAKTASCEEVLDKANADVKQAKQALKDLQGSIYKEKLKAATDIVKRIEDSVDEPERFDPDDVEKLMKRIRENTCKSTSAVTRLYADISKLKAYYRKFPIIERIKNVAQKLGFENLKITQKVDYCYEVENKHIIDAMSRVEYLTLKPTFSPTKDSPVWVSNNCHERELQINTDNAFDCFDSSFGKDINSALYATINGNKVCIATSSIWPDQVCISDQCTKSEREHLDDHVWTCYGDTYSPKDRFIPTHDYQIVAPLLWEMFKGENSVSLFNLEIGNSEMEQSNRLTVNMFNESRAVATYLDPKYLFSRLDDSRAYRSLGEVGLCRINRVMPMADENIAVMLASSLFNYMKIGNLVNIKKLISADERRYKCAVDLLCEYSNSIEKRIKSEIEYRIEEQICQEYLPYFDQDSCCIRYENEELYIGDVTIGNLSAMLRKEIGWKYKAGPKKEYSVSISPISAEDIDENKFNGMLVSGIFVINSVCGSKCKKVSVYGTITSLEAADKYDTDTIYPSIVDGQLDGFYFMKKRG